VFRSAQGGLGIDDPVGTTIGAIGEGAWFRKGCEVAKERELAVVEADFSPATNLPRKTRLSTFTGRKNECSDAIRRVWSGARPPGAARSGHGMMIEPLVPSMEHAEEADLCAEVAGSRAISSDSFGLLRRRPG
jgi:hypothetical protein